MKLRKDEILVLRNVSQDGTSHKGFRWPKRGPVEAKDWKDTDQCGHGLHGLPWGCGGGYWYGEPALWLVVKVRIVSGNYRHGSGDMTDKCKFRRGSVVYCGDLAGAVALISAHAPAGSPVWFAAQSAGNRSTQAAGHASTQTAGRESTQAAGDRSTQKAGHASTQKAGNRSTQAAGDASTQKAGLNSSQTIHWHDGTEWRVSVRAVGPAEADKWYRFENGDWRPCTAGEVEEAEREARGGNA